MSQQSHLDDPRHWRDRAEEMRTLAEGMRDAESKRTMLQVADGYEKLAVRAEKRAAKR